MTQAARSELKGSYMLSPAPNKYRPLGDFDFKNPNDPDSLGKSPKFAYGTKKDIPARGIDVPGPGTYATDVAPLNNKNIAYWIGTERRKSLSKPGAHL